MSAEQKDWFEVKLEEGKTYGFCTCGLSQDMPFCDGAHKGTGMKSLKIIPQKSGSFTIRPLPYKVSRPEE